MSEFGEDEDKGGIVRYWRISMGIVILMWNI